VGQGNPLYRHRFLTVKRNEQNPSRRITYWEEAKKVIHFSLFVDHVKLIAYAANVDKDAFLDMIRSGGIASIA
jgi:hypothetical protein